MCEGPANAPTLPVHVRRLEAVLQGVSTGLLAGGAVFAATNALVLKGGPVVGPHLVLLGQFFVGYEVTFLGSLIGFAWGFAYGFLAGWGVGVVYNRVVTARAARGEPPAGARP